MSSNTLIVHSDDYANWIFDPIHPTQGRRFINGRNQFAQIMNESGHSFDEVEPRLATPAELARVHSEEYVREVVTDYECREWEGSREDLSQLAALFAGGTLVALDGLIYGSYKTAIHFPGAKHHAQFDHSSGFCVFADFALAADIAMRDFGKRVAILDFDAHHGDGTENLTADNPDVLTFSIHERGMFPGTGHRDDAERRIFNSPLTLDTGKGDGALLREVDRFLELAKEFKADLIFIAAGADGHAEDPLTHLQYSIEGYKSVARLVRSNFPDLPILIGGAGGYLPDTRTPVVWSQFAHQISIN